MVKAAAEAVAADVASIFSSNECEPSFFHPAVNASTQMVSRLGLRGPGNRLLPPLPAPYSPFRSPSGRPQALSAQARPPIFWALTGNQSLKLAGNMRWGGRQGRSMRGSRPVGALMHGLTAHTHLWLTLNSSIYSHYCKALGQLCLRWTGCVRPHE